MVRTIWQYMALFAVLAVIAGGVFWARCDEADWWANVVDADRASRPKFKLQWPEQLLVSAVVGATVAGLRSWCTSPVQFGAE